MGAGPLCTQRPQCSSQQRAMGHGSPHSPWGALLVSPPWIWGRGRQQPLGWVEWGSSGGKFLAAGTVQLSPLGSLSRAQLRALFWRLFKKTLMKLCKPDLRNHKGAARRTSFHPLDLNQAEKQQQNILALTAIPLGMPCVHLQRSLVPASSC